MFYSFFFFLLFIVRSYFISFTEASVIVVAKCHSGGVVIGADTISFSGGMISSRHHQKIYSLDDHIMICCVSGERDFRFIFNQLKIRYHRLKIQNNLSEDKSILSINAIAHNCRLWTYSKFPKAHMIIVGKKEQSSQYKIFEIFPKGTLVEHDDYAVSGSGSECIVAMMNEYYENISVKKITKNEEEEEEKVEKERDQFSLKRLESQVKEAMKQSIKLDQRSRGIPRIISIP